MPALPRRAQANRKQVRAHRSHAVVIYFTTDHRPLPGDVWRGKRDRLRADVREIKDRRGVGFGSAVRLVLVTIDHEETRWFSERYFVARCERAGD
jgi:hypothetical protein